MNCIVRRCALRSPAVAEKTRLESIEDLQKMGDLCSIPAAKPCQDDVPLRWSSKPPSTACLPRRSTSKQLGKSLFDILLDGQLPRRPRLSCEGVAFSSRKPLRTYYFRHPGAESGSYRDIHRSSKPLPRRSSGFSNRLRTTQPKPAHEDSQSTELTGRLAAMATEDARYRQTSQYKLWSFSPTQLAAMRDNTNTAARTRIAERLASLPALSRNISAPTSSANTPDPDGTSTPSLPEFLTAPEEAQLVTFFTSELLRAGDHAEMSDDIKATAATFLRRFYVTNSIMTYPPQEMLIVALFFGCKAEGTFVNASESVSPVRTRLRHAADDHGFLRPGLPRHLVKNILKIFSPASSCSARACASLST